MPSPTPDDAAPPPASAPTVQLTATGADEAATISPLEAGVPLPAEAPVVPGYAILSELGRGGMGVVYKARQLRLNRIVALKMVLAGGHASEEDRRRFHAEAEAVARLSHPNIVQIHEIAEHAGLPYFSLEFCAGGSLADRLQGTPLPAEVAARLVQTLAQAMQHAHDAGIVHRDLKPANVLLSVGERGALAPRGQAQRVASPPSGGSHPPLASLHPKITDFGLAKKLGDHGQTATGTILGTPSYMAPEQARGDARGIGPHTDVYSLGSILYECLTGRPPFKAATAMETVLQVLQSDPAPPSQLQPNLPRDLETICLKCLRKEPAHRYASAGDLADDLGRWLAGDPIRARPIGRVVRLWRWGKRNPVVAGLLTLCLVTLALAFVNLRAGLASVQALAWRNQQLLAESVAGRLDERVRSNAQAVSLLSRVAEVKALLLAPAAGRASLLPATRDALGSILQANADFSSAFVLDADGTALASTNPAHPGRSYAFRDYFRVAAADRSFQSKVLIGTSTSRPGMYYSAPVRDAGGKVIGVVVVKMEATALWQIVEGVDVGEAGQVFLVDEDGIIIASRNAEWRFHSVAPSASGAVVKARFQTDEVPGLGIPALEEAAKQERPGSLAYTDPDSGARRLVAFSPLLEKPWIVAIDIDTRDAGLEQRLFARRGVTGLIALSGLLGTALVILFARRAFRRADRHDRLSG